MVLFGYGNNIVQSLQVLIDAFSIAAKKRRLKSYNNMRKGDESIFDKVYFLKGTMISEFRLPQIY